MSEVTYPDFIRKLPEADLPIADVVGYLLQSAHGQVCFFEFKPGLEVPEHKHGDQWGVVIEGEMELTIAGETKRMAKGDSYFIPSGTLHSARFLGACKVLDFFADKNRYQAK